MTPTVHHRAFGTLLFVAVLLAACQPVTRPESPTPATTPVAAPAFTEADIPNLIDQLDNPNWLVAHQEAEALATLGVAGRPALRSEFVSAIQSSNWPRIALILRTLEQMPAEGVPLLSGILTSPIALPNFRALSALGLSRMGQPGRDALVAAIENKQVVAISAAPLLGEQALPVLRSLTGDSSVEATQKEVLAALVALGEAALADQIAFFDASPEHQSAFIKEVLHVAAANPLLRHIAGGAYPDDIRTLAVAALGDTSVAPVATVPLLVGLVQDGQLPVDLRRTALASLGNYGTQAAEAIPLVEELLATPGGPLQDSAAPALGQIGAGRSEIVAQLASQLVQCDPVSAAAAQALGNMSLPARPAVESLLDVFDTCTDDDTLAATAAALGKVAPATPAVVAALSAQLTEAATHSGSPVTEAAATALGRLGPVALPTLATALAGLPAEAKAHITATLASMGPVAAPALIDALLLPTSDAVTQQAAAAGLAQIGSPALPFVVAALSEEEYTERQRLVDALYAFDSQAFGALHVARNEGLSVDRAKLLEMMWCIAADSVPAGGSNPPCAMAADVLPFLIAALQSPTDGSAALSASERESIVKAIGLLGPSAAAAAPLLGQALVENDVMLQCAAAQALQKMGGGAALAGPAALQAFAQADAAASCGDVSLRRQLIDTLGNLGPDAEFAMPQLMDALAEPALRRHAAEALGAIGGAAHARLLASLSGVEMDNESVDRRRAAAYALRQSSTAWGPVLAAQVTALAQNTDENRYVRAMLAAGLAEQGYPLDGIWSQLDLPNPAAQVCWNWPAIHESGGIVVMGYDLYEDACLFAAAPGADLIENLINFLVETFG